jgi:hypothetical protein
VRIAGEDDEMILERRTTSDIYAMDNIVGMMIVGGKQRRDANG